MDISLRKFRWWSGLSLMLAFHGPETLSAVKCWM
uniref:Uncharacterized protein n=1 Tax=Manihot esculenta TaxID=3983 RepID=A0A2C9VZE3_MANES